MVQQLKESRQRLSKISIKPKQTELIEEYKFAEALHNISTTLHNSLNLTEVIDWILANIEHVADVMAIEANSVYTVCSRSRPEYSQFSWRHFSLFKLPVLYHVFKTEEALTISDTHTWFGWIDMPQSGWSQSFISSLIWLPGKVAGFLNLTSAQSGFYKNLHTQRLQVFVDYRYCYE